MDHLFGFTHWNFQSYRIDRLVKRPSKLVSPQNTQDALEKILQLIGHSSLAFAGKFVSVCCLFNLQIIHDIFVNAYLSTHMYMYIPYKILHNTILYAQYVYMYWRL